MARLIDRIRAAIRVLAWRTRADEELNDELRFHLEREVQERVTGGMTLDEARRTALRSMGAVEKHKEECRDVRRGRGVQRTVGAIVQDTRFALRLFRKQPMPAVLAILGLGLAIGASTAVFTLFNAYLFRPYGMDDPGTVVKVARAGSHWAMWPYARFRALPHAPEFAGIEASADARVAIATSAVRSKRRRRHGCPCLPLARADWRRRFRPPQPKRSKS